MKSGNFHSISQIHKKQVNLLMHALYAQQHGAVMWRAEREHWDKRNLQLWFYDKHLSLKQHTLPNKSFLSTLYLMKHTLVLYELVFWHCMLNEHTCFQHRRAHTHTHTHTQRVFQKLKCYFLGIRECWRAAWEMQDCCSRMLPFFLLQNWFTAADKSPVTAQSAGFTSALLWAYDSIHGRASAHSQHGRGWESYCGYRLIHPV